MIKDGQVREMRRLLALGKPLAASARMTFMNEKTARRYRDDDRLPSQRKKPRDYRTRIDPFADVWIDIQRRLEGEPRLQAKTLFQWLQETHPGRFPDSTRRTFERRVARWRSLDGPGKTVIFEQVHHPGRLAASDFTVCDSLDVRIAGARFEHTFFHCVLTYSNVESVSLCFSESFEALSEGIQKAFWEFGGVPEHHRTDSLSAAVHNHSSAKLHTDRYTALMEHYRCQPERTNPRCANENGDVESQNGHLKNRIDQALLLRGSRHFPTREDYVAFVQRIIDRANANRRKRFAEDQAKLSQLPDYRLDTDDLLPGIKVSRSSTIQVRTNTYSVPSRLIGSKVDVRVAAETITVTHHGHVVQTMQRLYGKQRVAINYRHVIDSLVRKPGAFANYRYREEMFPNSQFRIAYDMLHEAHVASVADKKYIGILELAARESQEAVTDVLRVIISAGKSIDMEEVCSLVEDAAHLPAATDVEVDPPNLSDFDVLLLHPDMESLCNDQGHYTSNGESQNGTNDTSNQIEDGAIGEARLDGSVDRTVPGASPTEFSGSLCRNGEASSEGESFACGLPFGADDSGMRDPTRGPYQTIDQPFQTSARQGLGVVQLQPTAAACDAATGDASRRLVPGSTRERSAFREARFGEEPRLVRTVRATDVARPKHDVHDVQLVGPALVGGQAGVATAKADQATLQLRRLDHRRPGLRPTESRGDGSSVHASGGALRARQRAADEQLGVQQMGPDLQGRDDNRGSDRSPGSSQRDHRTQRAELSRRGGENEQDQRRVGSWFNVAFNFVIGKSSCR